MVKVNEKTLEINLCSEISNLLGRAGYKVFWQGFTQAEEQQNGLDTATFIGGKSLFIQWKSVKRVNGDGRNCFSADDIQMQKLIRLSKAFPSSVYYGLPLVPTWNDVFLSRNRVLGMTRFLNASLLSSVKSIGKQNSHTIKILPKKPSIAQVYSKPTSVITESYLELFDFLKHAGQDYDDNYDFLKTCYDFGIPRDFRSGYYYYSAVRRLSIGPEQFFNFLSNSKDLTRDDSIKDKYFMTMGNEKEDNIKHNYIEKQIHKFIETLPIINDNTSTMMRDILNADGKKWNDQKLRLGIIYKDNTR